MADVPNIEDKITDTEVGFNQPVSEQLNTRYGGNINNLIDENNAQQAQIDALVAQDVFTRVDVIVGVGLISVGVPYIVYTVPAGKVFIGGVELNSITENITIDVFSTSVGNSDLIEHSIVAGAFTSATAPLRDTSNSVMITAGNFIKVIKITGIVGTVGLTVYGMLIDS